MAPHLIADAADRRMIGKFCQIALGVTFIASEANHRHDRFSTVPFATVGGGIFAKGPSLPQRGVDTMIGQDARLGRRAAVLPGADGSRPERALAMA